MRILFTGGSSFTGMWFAKALRRRGHEISAVLTKARSSDYAGLRGERVVQLQTYARCLPGLRTDDGTLARALASDRQWELLCLHGAEVTGYKSPDFNWRRAFENNMCGIGELLDAFAAGGGRAVLCTGTYFEADEGEGSEPIRAFSPYGLAKTLTWQATRHECERRGLSVGKFVLPNPIGPYEEPKLVSYLVGQWKKGVRPLITCPDYIRDNAPVQALAVTYAEFAERLVCADSGSTLRINPSGWVSSIRDFCLRVAAEFSRRSAADFGIDFVAQQNSWDEPKDRHNVESCLGNMPAGEECFWSEWYAYYFPRIIDSVRNAEHLYQHEN